MAIREIDPSDVAALLAQGSVFIDVREDHERASGQAEGARGIAKAVLAAQPVQPETVLVPVEHAAANETPVQSAVARQPVMPDRGEAGYARPPHPRTPP